MKTTTAITLRNRTALAAGALVLVSLGLQAGPAAAQAPAAPPLTGEAATALAGDVGSAGAYLDPATGRMVITVTTEAAAQRIREAGGVPKTVRYTAADLLAGTEMLNRDARIAGTAWSVDPMTNQIVVTTDETVSGEKLARLTAVTSRLGDRVRVESSPGVLSTHINSGRVIFGGNSGCSLGFNVRTAVNGAYYFLTAGHCTNIATTWYQNSTKTAVLGTRADSSYPTNDYGIVRYNNGVSHTGNVYLYGAGTQDVSRAADAYVNEKVRRSGMTSGVHSGVVTALNVTVNYPDGTVYGMIKTNVCSDGGDSGGPLFDNKIALGLTSGGNGTCATGGTTYFQPVTEALRDYNVSIY